MDRRLFAVPPLLALIALALVGTGAGAQGEREPHIRLGAAAAAAKAPPARSLAAATGDDRRYALANGCYALRSQSAGGFVAKAPGGYRTSAASVGEAEAFRMQATALGSYLFYGRDRDFMAGGALNVVSPAGDASPAADWRVDANPGGTFTDGPAFRRQGALGGGRQAGARGAGQRGRLHLRARRRLRGLPGGRDQRDRPTLHEPDGMGPGQGDHRPPPAHDGVRVPRRPRPLRPALASIRGAACAGRLPRPPGRERLRRGARERALRQPRPLPRPRRLADLQGLAAPRLADPRADLLQVARARLHGRAAGVREPVRRQPGALRALPAEAERLRRDGLGAAPEPRPRGARGLHRRSERRAGAGLVPDRDRPVPGPARDRRAASSR